jgi:hypothetical protein
MIAAPCIRLLRHLCVTDLCDPLPWVSDLAKGPIAQIQTTTSNEGTTVGDSDDDRFAVLLIGDLQACTKREVSVRGGSAVAIEAFTVRCSLAVESITVSVVRRSGTGLRRGAGGQSGKQCQCSGAESDYSFLQW